MMTRPKNLNDEQKLIIAGKMVDELIKCNNYAHEDRDNMIADLVRYGRPHSDGYELAKDLDSFCSWQPDATTVEILDGWSLLYSSEVSRLEKDWSEANPVDPPFPAGTVVEIVGWKKETGTIDGIYEHGPAKFLIKVNGDKRSQTSHRIVNFEDVNLVVVDAVGINPASVGES